MIDTYSGSLDHPVFVDESPSNPNDLKLRDELKEWLARRIKERINKIKEENQNE